MLRRQSLTGARRVMTTATTAVLFMVAVAVEPVAAQSPPTVTAVNPTSGPVAGGTPVTIRGSGFTGATTVDFGSSSASFIVSSDTSIKATTPAETEGTVDVTVTTPDGTSAMTMADQFTFTPPTVTGLAPTSGPVAGGTPVTIRGSGFTGATTVDFGSSSASFVVNSDTSIRATTPAEPVGTVDVTVTTPDGTSAIVAADEFTFTPPTVTGVSPTSGSQSGGTTVNITGSGFTGATTVDFGSGSASFIVNSDTSIKATTPSEPVGTVDVRVTTPDGTSAIVVADEFTFKAATVTGVSPRSGPSTGGSVITITGTGLLAVTAVTFGTTPAPSFAVMSDSSITATSPAELPGKVHITVTTASGTSAVGAADKFTFSVVPTVVSGVSPASGPTSGKTTVTITGMNFTGATIVYFGADPASSVVVNSDNSITATSPAEAAGKVDVIVSGPGGTSSKKKSDKFTFVAPPPMPTVTHLSPASGPTSGGTTVIIKGKNLTGVTAVKFGTAPALSFVVNSNKSVSATSPPEKAEAVDVTVVSPGGTSSTSTADRFTFGAGP